MKKISRNKQKDKRPLAGLLGLKQFLVVPISIFAVIASTANMAITSTF